MFYLHLVASLLLAQAAPRPFDAYQANYASIHAQIKYKYTRSMGGDEIADKIRKGQDPGLVPDRRSEIDGEWSCDGAAEHFFFSSPEDVIQTASQTRPQPGHGLQYVPKVEAIFDGTTFAGWMLDLQPTIIDVQINKSGGWAALGKGPFRWHWLDYPLPHFLEVHFPKVVPVLRQANFGGNPVEVELYELVQKDGALLRLELWFDPMIGYIPRFARYSQLRPGESFVSEMVLKDAKPCLAGGFIASEWYDFDYSIFDFDAKYSRDKFDLFYEPSGPVQVGHFMVTESHELSGQVSLTHLDKVTHLSLPGGLLPIVKSDTRGLTLAQIKAYAGRKLTEPTLTRLPQLSEGIASSPHGATVIDADEVAEFANHTGNGGWTRFWAFASLATAGLAIYLTLRRRKASLLLGILLLASGCSQAQPSVVRLSGGFTEDYLIYDPSTPAQKLTLAIKNVGNQPLKLFKASGGCTCRRIDQTKFPSVLGPNQLINLDTSILPQSYSGSQSFVVDCETDRGVLRFAAAIKMFPKHQLSPSSSQIVMEEDSESSEIEVVHRSIFVDDGHEPVTSLKAPKEFAFNIKGTVSEKISVLPSHRYRDTTYIFTLRAPKTTDGLKKSILTFEEKDSGNVIEFPVVWRRQPYLATVPERITLAQRPVRAFLRCPDERVELIRVLSSPPGIKAVVSSLRELTVMVDTDSPRGPLEGFVVVETSAIRRAPLKIPVVRYQPTVQ